MKSFAWGGAGVVLALVMPMASHAELERKLIPVEVRVDFGPAGESAREARLMVDPGSTPKDVASLLFPIESSAVCCDTRELSAINGVRADPAKNRWWTCSVNGSRHVSPFKRRLRSGDRIVWTYVEQPQ